MIDIKNENKVNLYQVILKNKLFNMYKFIQSITGQHLIFWRLISEHLPFFRDCDLTSMSTTIST